MDLLDISSIEGSECGLGETHGRDVLVISVDIGNGRTEEITLKEKDTPKSVAEDFCKKHDLNPDAAKVLIDVIKDHLRIKPVVEVSMMVDQPEKKDEPKNFEIKNDTKDESKAEKTFDQFKAEKTFDQSKAEKTFDHFKAERTLDHSKISRFSQRPNCGERLYNEGLKQKEKHDRKITELRQQIDKEKMKESTFRPNISPERQMPRLQLLSPELVVSKPVDRCEALYKLSQKSISNSPSKIISNSPNKLASSSPSVSQKVLNSRKNLQLYLEQREQDRNVKKRAKTPSSLPREKSRRPYRSQSQERKVKLSNEQTDKIINRIKTIRFVQLFETLNPNENQQINKYTVEGAKLSRGLFRILEPFIAELRRLKHGLSLDQFCRVMELYIREMTPEDRGILLQTGKKRGNSGYSKNMTMDKELSNDLWSPKHEEKLLAFEHFPEYT